MYRIFDKGVKADKLNFRRLNIFGAYVNASFKGGVFNGAPTDSAWVIILGHNLYIIIIKNVIKMKFKRGYIKVSSCTTAP